MRSKIRINGCIWHYEQVDWGVYKWRYVATTWDKDYYKQYNERVIKSNTSD